jgi:membrane fusion protein
VTLGLFRKQVIDARSHRVAGEVMISPSRAMWTATGVLVTFCAGVASFAATASYARSELVQGSVGSVLPVSKILVPRPGIVTDVLVEEGQAVRKGQVLARLRVEQATLAGEGTATASLQALDQQRALAGKQMSLELVRVTAERMRLTAQLTSSLGQLAEVERQIAVQQDLIASTRVAVDQAEKLIASGFMTRSDLEQRRQSWLAATQAARQLAQTRSALEGQAATARAELARLPVDSAVALTQIRANIAQLEMASAQQSGEQGYQIVAPITGRVTAVQTARGRFADGRVPLLTIVPEGARMRAELFAPSRAMGFVRQGQEVRVMYDAFPYQRFGSFPGRVEQVSRTVIAPGESDIPLQLTEPVYRIRVALPQQGVPAYGGTAPLQPGMTLKANIVLERRSFLEWLLDPVMAVRNRT